MKKIKVKIVKEGKRIWIPPLYFWFLRMLLPIVLIFMKKTETDERRLRRSDIKDILKVLDDIGPFVLADIDIEEEDTKVYVEIM